MSKIHVDFIRGKRVESTHQVKALVRNIDGIIILSNNYDTGELNTIFYFIIYKQ